MNHHLSLEKFTKTIQNNFPTFTIHSTQFLGEGVGNASILVNDEWVFRFSKTQEASKDLEKEIKILPYLAKQVTLAIPEFEYFGAQENGLLFVGYKKLAGEILAEEKWAALSGQDLEKIAERLANFMDELSAFPLEIARSCHVPENDFKTDFERAFENVKTLVFPVVDEAIRQHVTSTFENYLANPNHFDYSPTLLHADLSPDHYLIDPNTHELTGIIDFGDLHIGDPDFEYAYILEDCGEIFTRRVMEFRGKKDIDELLKKVSHFVTFSHVASILEGVKRGEATWVREGINMLNAEIKKNN